MKTGRTPTALLRERFPHLCTAPPVPPPDLSQCQSGNSQRTKLTTHLSFRGLPSPQFKVAKLGSGSHVKYMAMTTVDGEQYKTYPRTFPSQVEAEEAVAGIALSKLGQVNQVHDPPPTLHSRPPPTLHSRPPPTLHSRPLPVVCTSINKAPLQQSSRPTSPSTSVCGSSTVIARKVRAEELFQASLAADNDSWLQFQIEPSVAAREQSHQLEKWLEQHRPSLVTRSQGVGWIAVKLRDKGRKVVEAKVAWEEWKGERSMQVVNQLAEQFGVEGGKWMCHLAKDGIDEVWGKVARTLLSGGLGSPVYMVKVSPVDDSKMPQADGEHVLIVYNTDYRSTEQVMRVENLLRSAGVASPLNYKPDIFSALGIYRNNKWGFRPTIYTSRCLVSEGRSRVETVGTGECYYNSSKGLERPGPASGVCPVEEGRVPGERLAGPVKQNHLAESKEQKGDHTKEQKRQEKLVRTKKSQDGNEVIKQKRTNTAVVLDVSKPEVTIGTQKQTKKEEPEVVKARIPSPEDVTHAMSKMMIEQETAEKLRAEGIHAKTEMTPGAKLKAMMARRVAAKDRDQGRITAGTGKSADETNKAA